MPTINLQIDEYASLVNKFIIINDTSIPLDSAGPRLHESLVVNTKSYSQPFDFHLENTSQLLEAENRGVYSGLVFEEWSSYKENSLILLYNDTALLSVPYLINLVTNMYTRTYGRALINASLSAWPKTAESKMDTIDSASLAFLGILGIGILIPLVTFATEIVHDREVS